jgi:hypothetical protein
VISDQDGGIGLVALTGVHHLVGRDRKTPTAGVVKQAAEHRLGVKAWQA